MLVDLLIILAKILIVFVGLAVGVMVSIYLERRVAAFISDRLGPNRVGPMGLFQPLADGLKFFMKEDIIVASANRFIYLAAPVIIMVPAFMTFAVIPVGPDLHALGRVIPMQIADVNIGILYILALTSLGVYGIVLGGWGSNSKYPLLGGLRSSAQLISYELSMGLALIAVLMLSGSLQLNDIVVSQQGLWNVVRQPVAFLIFLTAVFAETNRLPFDLPEAEQELVGGYHTEYSSMKFAMFFMAEYANMITASALITTLFFGGWDIPFVSEVALGNWGVLLGVIAFTLKTLFFIFFFIWVRWSFPRFRYDQVMRLGWQMMLPVALANILVTGLVMAYL